MDIAITPSGAQFSRCRRWRYLLWRRWDESKPVANFLMLNPSTADELKLAPGVLAIATVKSTNVGIELPEKS